LLAALTLFAVSAWVGGSCYLQRFSEAPTATATGTVEIIWPRETTPGRAAALLAGAGLTENQTAMALYLRTTGGTADFKPGAHILPRGTSPAVLRALLTRTDERPKAKLTIPEGWHRFDIAERLDDLRITSRRAFLTACADPMLLATLPLGEAEDDDAPESADGFLFPATYEMHLDTAAEDVIRRLVEESKRRWDRLVAKHADGLARLQEDLEWGRREIMVLASMVEKEAAVAEERPVIASVFLNRLTSDVSCPLTAAGEACPRRLQSDPTVAYGCIVYPNDAPSCRGFTGRVTPAMVRDRLNPYSTYTRDDLPPGPISNPGEESIEAVLAPDETNYFYFVAIGGGRHRFTETYADHQRAVQESNDSE